MLFFCRISDQPFIDLPDVPVRRYRIPTFPYIIKFARPDRRFLYKIFADAVYVVAVIDVCQIVYLCDPLFSQSIYIIFSRILCPACDIINQTTCKKLR